MAQQGRNGHHQDNGADTTSYMFNPMAYNYSQHHAAASPLTVLSQQDATVMADFFNNPDTTSNDNAYMPYGIEGKPEFTNNITSDAAMTNHHVHQSHVTFTSHSMPQANRIPVNIFEYSPSFLQNNHNQQTSNSQSAGDAVAGASALLGLSSSQEQANLLGANSYMTWPNIVGAHLQAPMNNTNNVNNTSQSTVSPMRNPPVKSHSTSRIQTQIQPPPTPTASWADMQAQEIAMRTRHPSLQLDTTNTHFPTHQQAWQNAPMSAAPHAGRRPPLMKFGSDNHFSPHGFTGPVEQQDEKGNNLLHMATVGDLATNASTAAQAQRTMTSLGHRHSITAGMPIMPTAHQSPVMVGGIGNTQLQNTFHTGQNGGTPAGNNQSRKRTFSQVDNGSTAQANHDNDVQSLPQTINGQRGVSTTGYANGASNAASQARQPTPQQPAASTGPPTSRRRTNGREPRAPRQNLTDAQKRQNHIASEQKRRDTMKTNYEILGQRVAAVRDGGAMSRSEILHHVANHMEAVISGNQVMCGLAGITLAQLDELPDSDDEQSDGGED